MSITAAELTEVVRELFKALDKDNSGFLERNEVHEIAAQLHGKIGGEGAFNEDAFSEAFTKLDKNGDGKIAFDELCSWFFRAAEKRGLLVQ
jgi:Ca2+-binding EF-hand superfamily protein